MSDCGVLVRPTDAEAHDLLCSLHDHLACGLHASTEARALASHGKVDRRSEAPRARASGELPRPVDILGGTHDVRVEPLR